MLRGSAAVMYGKAPPFRKVVRKILEAPPPFNRKNKPGPGSCFCDPQMVDAVVCFSVSLFLCFKAFQVFHGVSYCFSLFQGVSYCFSLFHVVSVAG